MSIKTQCLRIRRGRESARPLLANGRSWNAVVAAGALAVATLAMPFPAQAAAFTETDYAVWRPSEGVWYILKSANSTTRTAQWGARGDVPVPGNWIGGRTEIAVWRPSNGVWYIKDTDSDQTFTKQWGTAGDIPTPADFDGDGYLDFAVWRPSEATFHIQYNSRRQGVDGAKSARMLGQPGDIPVPGNYRNDIYGRAGVAVYRPSTSVWYLTAPPCVGCDSSTLLSPRVGAPGDVPVPGDYDGDGILDPATFRPSKGEWRVLQSSTGYGRDFSFGAPGLRPMGVWQLGSGQRGIALWEESTGTWYVRNTTTGAITDRQWGTTGDIPVPAAYDRIIIL